MIKRITAVMLTSCICLGAFAGCTSKKDEYRISLYPRDKIVSKIFGEEREERIEFLKEYISSELEYLNSLALPNGAIGWRPLNEDNQTYVNPYQALMTAKVLMYDTKYVDTVKNYIKWHISGLNTYETDYNKVDGTIYDYNVKKTENGEYENIVITGENGKSRYDSTDSYAALFLDLVCIYYEKTGDKDFVLEIKDDLLRVSNAMRSTLDKGLTFAKPDYKIKYLMDNCEVYKGYQAYINLMEKVILKNDGSEENKEILSRLKKESKIMKNKILNTMYDDKAKLYVPFVYADESYDKNVAISKFYPDAMCQAFPVIFGLSDPKSSREQEVYRAFCEEYSSDKKGYYFEQMKMEGTSFYDMIICVYCAAMGDHDRTYTFLKTYKEKAVDTGRKYPLYSADHAMSVQAAIIFLNDLT